MLNYIKAEFYRNFNRAYYWVYTGSIAALALLINILIASSGSNIDFSILFEAITRVLIMPIFLVAVFIEIATAEEHKNLTLKNAVSFGVPRSKIALSKVIVTVVLSLIAAVIIFSVYFGSGALLLGVKAETMPLIRDSLLRILTAVPLWVGAVAVGTFIAIVINSSTAGAFIYAGVFTLVAPAIKLLATLVSDKFDYILQILITSQLLNLRTYDLPDSVLIRAAGIGVAYTILFTILSMLYIKKKEIK